MAEDKLESVSGVIPQIINLLCMNKHEENVKLADLVIRPNVKGYSAASFSARAIDSLLARGKVAALQDWGEIMRVKALDRRSAREGCPSVVCGLTGRVRYPGDTCRGTNRQRRRMGAPEDANTGE